jgi:ubiquinone/menaquinone biosynthesis C-methylase UbiE
LSQESVFDQSQYQALNLARGRVLEQLVLDLGAGVKSSTGKPTAIDIACGAGHFSNVLSGLGFDVLGIDARAANVEESSGRFPDLKFAIANVEDLGSIGSRTFDLVICFGLLYHLENPFRAIRGLHAVTGETLIVESMCAPGAEPSMQLLDEFHAEDQGMNYVAFCPTEACLVKMLFRAGFPFVYKLATVPDHRDFREDRGRRRARTMLVASKDRLDTPTLVPLQESTRPLDIWSRGPGPLRRLLGRVARSMRNFAALTALVG